MPTRFIRWMLFISSYSPLTLIIFVLYIVPQPIYALVTLGIGIVGVVFTLVFFRIARNTVPVQEKIEGQQLKDADVMGYISAYIIPLATYYIDGWQQIAVLLIFFIILGIVYTNSEMTRINPALNLLGYHLFEVTVENGAESYALFTRRQKIRRGDTIRMVDVGRGIFLEKTA